jgi:hypothetical protein
MHEALHRGKAPRLASRCGLERDPRHDSDLPMSSTRGSTVRRLNDRPGLSLKTLQPAPHSRPPVHPPAGPVAGAAGRARRDELLPGALPRGRQGGGQDGHGELQRDQWRARRVLQGIPRQGPPPGARVGASHVPDDGVEGGSRPLLLARIRRAGCWAAFDHALLPAASKAFW